MKKIILIILIVSSSLWASPALITPGTLWPDNRGIPIQAHGGCILKVGSTWYWFGEDRSKDNDPNLRYVSCYSSTDLANWHFCSQVIKADDPAKLGPGWILERPKVFYNSKTQKYVMYTHLDNKHYGAAEVGLFISDTIDGNYRFVRSFRPLGHQSRDIGQFVDDDGSAYLIFEDRPLGLHIAKLSNDYLNVEKDVHLFRKEDGGALEGGALVHYMGLYYAVGSQLTSWAPNSNKYAVAPSLGGPWSKFEDISPPEKKTYGSQSTYLLKVVGNKTTSIIFMGDIWHPYSQWNSRYLWMPLLIGHGKLSLPRPQKWAIDSDSGEVFTDPKNNKIN